MLLIFTPSLQTNIVFNDSSTNLSGFCAQKEEAVFFCFFLIIDQLLGIR